MRSPLEGDYKWLWLDEVASTQDAAADILAQDNPYGIVCARTQTQGRGRFGRTWLSTPGDSLTMSLIFRPYADDEFPHLVGMAVAIAAAMSVHTQLQWPNDLVLKRKKVGGMITELRKDSQGRLVPIVGLGINLNQTTFDPSILHRAISVKIALGGHYSAQPIAEKIVANLTSLPEPTSWRSLRDVWNLFDQTPGKQYQVNSSETGIAIGIGSGGELLCTVEGETRSIFAADAIFGLEPEDL